jgi:hypothetical protein
MPHDKNGALLNVGDAVIVSMVVTSVSAGEDYCNVMCDTVEPMFPGDAKSSIWLNTKQVVKDEPRVELAHDDYRFSLEQKVWMRPNSRFGKVIGLLTDRDRVHWYFMQYSDTAGMIHETYLREKDLAEKAD